MSVYEVIGDPSERVLSRNQLIGELHVVAVFENGP